jgi:hypothetical protein
MKKTILSLLTAGSLAFAAGNYAALKITNSTLEIDAQAPLTYNNIYVRGSFLYNDNDGKHNYFSVGIKGEGNLIGIDVPNMKFSIIMDAVHIKNNTAIPLGIGAFAYVPNLKYPVFVRGEAEYAPKILSFKDANRFSRIDVSMGIQPIENAEIFVGYRDISFNHNYNSAIYGGIGYNF